MKRLVALLSALFFCTFAYGATETINWYVGDNLYTTTTCESGGDITLPTAPTKYGYTFQGWAGHVPIEYLESTGTQAIDTNFVFSNPNTAVVIKFKINDLKSGQCLTGSENNTTGWAFILGTTGNGIKFYHAPNVSSACSYNTSTENEHVVKMIQNNAKYSIIIDNYEKCVFDNSVSGGYTTTTFSLFADKYNTGDYTQKVKARIYYCQIYENDILVRDFIPVLDSVGIPCMYDKVEQKFYYNSGTGDFIAGPIVSE